MKGKFFFASAIFLLCFAANSTMAQSGKLTYKVTLKGYSVITASDCSVMPLGATGGLVTIVKAADNADQQFDKDMKNQTKFATMDVVAYDGGGKKTKTYHFTNLQVKSVAPNVNKISAVGLSFDNETEQ